MFKWGDTSRLRMTGVDEQLVALHTAALSKSRYDMTIPWMGGLRTAADQQKLFHQGVTQCDGYKNKSYHQSGMALDVAPVKAFKAKTSEKQITIMYNHYAQIVFDEFKTGNYDGVLHWGGFFGNGWDKAHWERHYVK